MQSWSDNTMDRTPSRLKAAAWMGGWLFLMLVLAIAGRETTRELNVFQVMEVRSLIGFLMLLPVIALSSGLSAMRTARPLAHVSRNLAHYLSQLAWLYALTLIPLSQLVSIEFTMPVWITIMAALFIGERITLLKGLAVVLGLIGVVIIVRPSTGEINPGQTIALAAAFGFAISVTLTKSLTRADNSLKIVFWMTIVQSLVGLGPALYFWVWPSSTVWGWLVVIAFCGTFSHFCMARAMQYADATVVIPMDFLRVPLTALVGFLFYSELLDTYTVLGAALILAANAVNLKTAVPAVAASKPA